MVVPAFSDLGHPAVEAGILGKFKSLSLLTKSQIPATPAFILWYTCCAGMTL